MAYTAFKPTPEQRKMVQAMCAYGIPQNDICAVLGTTDKTFRKHFLTEIRIAATQANAKVAETAYQMAISGQTPSATFFWLKCRAGWRETDRDQSDPNIADALMKIADKLPG